MFILFWRLVIVALLALTGLVTEDTSPSLGEVVIDECNNDECTTPPLELPGP